jgi:hypothetical protein
MVMVTGSASRTGVTSWLARCGVQAASANSMIEERRITVGCR